MYRLIECRLLRAVNVLVLFAGLIGASGCTAGPQESTTGFDEYRISCASCHGLDGKGNGQMVSLLNVKPTDLTTLAKQNDGLFPAIAVYKVIDGRESFYAHGDRAMPVWGIRYLLDQAVKYGDYVSEQAVQERIDKLVEYIQSIQK